MPYFCSKAKNMNKSIHSEEYKMMINLLRSKRENSNVTQKQLAEYLGVTQAVVSKIEICERRIDIIELRNICSNLNVSFVDFIVELDKILKHD